MAALESDDAEVVATLIGRVQGGGPLESPVMRARTAGLLYLAGTVLSFAAAFVPSISGRSAPGLLAVTAAGLVSALAHLAFARRFGRVLFHGCGVLASMLVGGGLVFAGELRPAFAVLFVWIVLYFAYLFPPREAALQTIWALVAMSSALIALDPSWSSIAFAFVASVAILSMAALVATLGAATERRSAEQYRSLVEHIPLVTYVDALDDNATSLYMSPQIEDILGYSVDEWLDDPDFWERILHPADRERALEANRRHVATGEPFRQEYRLVTADGRIVWLLDAAVVDVDASGVPSCSRGYMLDITERKLLEEQLAHQALHDPLTGLANRALFRDRVEHALARRGRETHPPAVLFADVDDFKTVNDSLGHEVGDELLVGVAARIRDCVRPGDTAARLGGDEFAVLVEDTEPGTAGVAAARILAAMGDPFVVDGREVFASVSIGIAAALRDDGVEELLRNADVAMYAAKRAGKHRSFEFETTMHVAALERLERVNELRRALQRNEIAVVYQPIVDLDEATIVGAEALVRWEHPRLGALTPAEFIGLAEETGLVVPIGRFVREEACRQMRAWHAAAPGSAPTFMAVNLSPRELAEEGIVAEVTGLIECYDIRPGGLVLEVTEGALHDDADTAIRHLQALRELGARIAIDDFGTGYSSLAHLKRMPVDLVKIAKPFVDGLVGGERDALLARAVIRIGRALDIETVAEGIEHGDQHARLRSLRCSLGQGYHFARPIDGDAFETMLAERAGRAA